VTAERRAVARLAGVVRWALCLGLAAWQGGCRVDEDAFAETIFLCNTSNPACGTTLDGREMTCFQASQLDGNDFCAPKCGMAKILAGEEPATAGSVCAHGNAELRACNPTVDGSCGATLNCLRTDVTTDEGVCMTMQPCSTDEMCTDAVHSTCASTFLQELYNSPDLSTDDLHSDHLYCLQRGCKEGGSSCNPGQSCLPYLVDKAAHPPDICVPDCGSDYSCPPNHFCFREISGPGSPRICLPGLLGFLCKTDIDCMVGTCRSDGVPEPLTLNLCTVPCDSNADCEKWDSDQGKFVCIDHRCATPDAYRGARCYTDDDCTRDEGTACVFAGKPTSPTDQGTCSVVCGDGTGPDEMCSPRGGFGHVCLGFTVDRDGRAKHGCYPGYYGPYYTCRSNADCVDDLECLDVGTGQRLCTARCDGDAACQANRWTRGASTCLGGVCAPPQSPAKAPLSAEMM
jgi:hypothetical protein